MAANDGAGKAVKAAAIDIEHRRRKTKSTEDRMMLNAEGSVEEGAASGAERCRNKTRAGAGRPGALMEQVRRIERRRDQAVILLVENRHGWRAMQAIRKSLTCGDLAAWEDRRLQDAKCACLRQNDLHEGVLSDALMEIREACRAMLEIVSDISNDLQGWPLEELATEANRLSTICFCVEDAPMAPREEYDALFAGTVTLCAIVRGRVQRDEEDAKKHKH